VTEDANELGVSPQYFGLSAALPCSERTGILNMIPPIMERASGSANA
jgi:hypothetical protein